MSDWFRIFGAGLPRTGCEADWGCGGVGFRARGTSGWRFGHVVSRGEVDDSILVWCSVVVCSRDVVQLSW